MARAGLLALAASLTCASTVGASPDPSRQAAARRASAQPASTREGEGVYTLFKDGEAHEIATVTRDGDDFLSIADLALAVGARLSVDRASREARLELGASRIAFLPGSSVATLDGQKLELTRPTLVIAGRLYVPPDFVTEAIGAALQRAVRWKDEIADEAGSLLAAATGGGERRGGLKGEVEARSLRDYTRVLIRFGGSSVLPYTVNSPPGRIVIRIQGDDLSALEPEVLVGDGAVERVAFSEGSGRGTFTIELGGDYRDHQTAVLRDPFRVVVDVFRRSPYTGPPVRPRRVAEAEPEPAAPAPAAELRIPPPAPPVRGSRGDDLLRAPVRPAPEAPPEPPPPLPPAGQIASAGRRGGFRTVVLDAGHGGTEAGAKGPGNLLEKDVTLDLARRLGGLIERRLGLRVVLTRSRDSDLSLDDRTSIANHEKADLFLSIHANASLRKNARGVETYFLARSASDDESRKLAALENQAIGESRGLEGTDLELILWSLAQNQYLKESQELAEIIQKELNDLLGVNDRGVKQAPFKILVGATMPAVLVEVGFITNPAEERLLRDEAYKDKLAMALFASVSQFKQSRELKMGALSPRP